MIGFFRYDYGCHFDGAFLDSRYFESTDAALSKEALATLGWAKAPKGEREMVASYWVQKGLLEFSTVLETKDKDLNANEFHPPRAVTAEDGEVRVTLWYQMPTRTRRETNLSVSNTALLRTANRLASRQRFVDWKDCDAVRFRISKRFKINFDQGGERDRPISVSG